MIRTALILATLLAPALAMAQTASSPAPAGSSLDLSVPQAPIEYLSDPAYQRDPPGAFYGDKSGPRPVDADDGRIAHVTDDKLRLNGSFTTGIGYSKNFGNSHYNAASLNLSKNYTTDEGKTRSVNLNIHVSEGEGPGLYGRGGYYGRGGGWYDDMPPYGW